MPSDDKLSFRNSLINSVVKNNRDTIVLILENDEKKASVRDLSIYFYPTILYISI